ncbi:uncharacterized protein BKA55DRAFT_647451 [Fusarium redolens]|uniref:Fungal N-terminal domain-containing protein n=1 Tax=Fusarium redolens TaxID=48865 RepID=A0A9P9K578_FUSRE|nr:uncharacterized protein BKA55DRAFT_647451 [Fusarium redolens]KAH7244425.1 hypothetical protein BKA55DRAFT_647451 [Fusarium redolens]
MDPLSITSASVALAAAVYKCAIEVKKIVGTIADAANSLSDLAEEVQLIQGALQGVEDALQDNQEAISRYKVEEVFSIAVKGCRATLACIKQEFELLFNRSDWKARFMVLWKEDDMKKLLGRLDRKRESILLLLQLLSLSSVREVQALVAKKQSALTVAKEDITALIPTYWSCRDTILDSLDKETVDSIYADWENQESKLSTTEFDFDYEFFNTRAYRRALAQAQAKRSRQLPPRKELDTPARESNGGIMEPVEDLIDLSCEPSQQTTSMPSHMPSQSYTGLAGLQFMPTTAHDAMTEISQTETQQEGMVTNELLKTMNPNSSSLPAGSSRPYNLPSDGTPATISTLGNMATKSQTSLLIEYFEGGKGQRGPSSKCRPGIRVRLTPSKRKGVYTKHHPEVTETSRIDPSSGIPSDELLDNSPMGSSNPPNIGDSSLQRNPIDIEIDHSHRRRRPATKKNVNDSKYQSYDSGYIPDDDMRPPSRNIARRSRPKQSRRSQSTEANAGSPRTINNPKLLKTVNHAIRTLILPELNALKCEQAQRGRRYTSFTEADASPVRLTSALADGPEANEKEQEK